MDGLTATAEIRALPAPRSRIPIIALTANVLSDQVKALRAAGMDSHVGKPFRRIDLLEAIERCCDSGTEAEPAPAVIEPDASDAAPDPGILDDLVALAGLDQVLAWLEELRVRIDAIYPPAGTLAITDALMADNHTLISQSGMLGFTALSGACQAVEKHHRAGEDLAEPIRHCRTEAARAIAGCRSFAQAHPVEVIAEPLRIAV
jgi:CheY-like chemotaxis protein